MPIEDGVDVARLHDHRIAGGSVGPLTIGHATTITDVGLHLRPMSGIDPPVLLTLLEVRRGTAQTVHGQGLAA